MPFGGIVGGLTWAEYIEGMRKECLERFEALREWLSFNGLYCLTGDDIQNNPVIVEEIGRYLGPGFDGKPDTFSFRAWGDFLAAIFNELAGEVEYDYMDFYYTYNPFFEER